MGPIRDPPGADRTQVGPMWATLSRIAMTLTVTTNPFQWENIVEIMDALVYCLRWPVFVYCYNDVEIYVLSSVDKIQKR